MSKPEDQASWLGKELHYLSECVKTDAALSRKLGGAVTPSPGTLVVLSYLRGFNPLCRLQWVEKLPEDCCVGTDNGFYVCDAFLSRDEELETLADEYLPEFAFSDIEAFHDLRGEVDFEGGYLIAVSPDFPALYDPEKPLTCVDSAVFPFEACLLLHEDELVRRYRAANNLLVRCPLARIEEALVMSWDSEGGSDPSPEGWGEEVVSYRNSPRGVGKDFSKVAFGGWQDASVYNYKSWRYSFYVREGEDCFSFARREAEEHGLGVEALPVLAYVFSLLQAQPTSHVGQPFHENQKALPF